MANIILLGASYTDVPAVDLPKTGGGTVRFYEDEPSDLTTKTITLNGTYDPDDDNADGYSEVTVNVANGASMTEVQNQYGTELVITSAQSAAPSATRHTLYFEYEDTTTETEYAYYDDSFISSAITATTPTTRNNKTVTSAQLDGVEWYSYTPTPTPPEPSGDWTTIYDSTVQILDNTPYSQFWIAALSEVYPAVGEVWRITINGTAYTCTAHEADNTVYIGNPLYDGGTDDGSNIPFCFYNVGWGAWVGYGAKTLPTGEGIPFKAERQVSA